MIREKSADPSPDVKRGEAGTCRDFWSGRARRAPPGTAGGPPWPPALRWRPRRAGPCSPSTARGCWAPPPRAPHSWPPSGRGAAGRRGTGTWAPRRAAGADFERARWPRASPGPGGLQHGPSGGLRPRPGRTGRCLLSFFPGASPLAGLALRPRPGPAARPVFPKPSRRLHPCHIYSPLRLRAPDTEQRPSRPVFVKFSNRLFESLQVMKRDEEKPAV